MENQHQKITGYRDLSQGEIDLMNEIKKMEVQVAKLVNRMREMRTVPLNQRWVSIATTHLQEGFMALVRAVAQPASPLDVEKRS